MTQFYDNTTVSTHRNCPRKCYYRHIKHYRPEGTGIAAGFGISMHGASDSIWKDIHSLPREELNLGTIAKNALIAFVHKWDEEGLPDQDLLQSEFSKRHYDLYNLANAGEIIRSYILEKIEIIRRFKLIAVEQPFVVPLYPDRTDVMYCGRIDKVLEDEAGNIWILDHKTTSAYATAGGFRSTFLDSFSPNSQIDGYSYAAIMLYGDRFKGCYIDGILVHKKERKTCHIPVERDIGHLDNWLSDTREEIGRIEEQKALLKEAKPTDKFLPVFPKNTNRCFDFNSPCSYLDLCKCIPNPHFETVPMGFVVEEWSPFDKNELEKIGMKR